MGDFTFNGLLPPFAAHRDIMDYVLSIDPKKIKIADLCCGLGFGKTVLGIQIAVLALNFDGNQRGLFLEPDWDRVKTIFIPKWLDIVPDNLYTWDKGTSCIRWYNGAYMFYRPRVITGSKARSRSKQRGIEYSFVIDDETAVGFDLETYQNTFARIRRASPIKFYLTLSTPLVGPYGRFLKRGGNKVFRGRTRDNIYLPDRYEEQQRANMSVDQARRELDGELVALEGRIWKDCDITKPWPKGNLSYEHPRFDKSRPWYLFCDLGSSNGAYLVVQPHDATNGAGQWIYDNETIWVAVADLCPHKDANAADAFRRLKSEFGTPECVVGGKDMHKRSNTDSKTVAYFARKVWSNVRIVTTSEERYARQIQFDRMCYMFCSASDKKRRLLVAKDFVSLDKDSKRGFVEMIEEDQWPTEEKSTKELLPKSSDVMVQHIRDAALMGTVEIMAPPEWAFSED